MTSLRIGTAVLLSVAPVWLDAQGTGAPETVRGRVTSDSGAIVGATVIVTRGPDRLVQQTTTDSAGRYTLRFDPGTGDYLVYVAAPNYLAARRRVQRDAADDDASGALVADFALARDVATLAAVRVTANRPVRADAGRNAMKPEPGSAERWADGVDGQLPPSSAGDLDALAGTIPGITMTPSGPSVLGAGAEGNLVTLNGLGAAGLTIPRGVRTQRRVTSATFDATRGGFAGANVDVQLGPGSRESQNRTAFLALEPEGLQFAGPAGHGTGSRTTAATVSLGADGELIRRALTYNVALDVSRTATDARTLFDSDRSALLQAGIAPDSVARLSSLVAALGLPLGPAAARPERKALTWLGRFDDTRDSLDVRSLTTFVAHTRQDGLGATPLSASTALGRRKGTTMGLQATWRAFTGPGRRILSESRAAASRAMTEGTAFATIPGASVTVRSALDGAAPGAVDVTTVAVGGAPLHASRDDRWTAEGANETLWNWRGSRHRFKSLVWARADGIAQELPGNRRGTFRFASISDLAAGRASSFTRTLTQPDRSGSAWNFATALAHEWIPSRHGSVIYGARLEASGFSNTPPRNTDLEKSLGVRTSIAPTRLHVSPRLGFTYTYDRHRTNSSGIMANSLGQFNRGMTGMIRGGVGEFRGLLRPDVVADAAAATGLAGATTTLSCVGDAVPAADWAAFAEDPGAIPSACAANGGVLSERVPSVTLLDPGYDAPRSWRASLEWVTNVRTWVVRVSTLGSYDLAQPGTVDANFAGVPRFSLASEAGRPVYVAETGIDSRSGVVSAVESRRSMEYGRVAVRSSDLRGYGGQLTVGLAPDAFRFRSRIQVHASANYTLQASRRQYRGFDGAAFGDPRMVEWAPGGADARHAFVLSGGVNHRRTGTVTFFGRLQSGLPFTPVVQGDVNGDGRAGDRAFVPPAAPGDDDALAGLHASGSDAARACLARYAGRVADRNGCRGPWTQSLNLQWVPPIPRRWLGRVSPRVYLQNVLGGVDQLLHGERDLRGWGAQASPDPVLLIPRGFDPATRAFRYDVNPRFADTRPAHSLVRNPFRITIDVVMDLSVPYPLQRLRRALEPVPGPGGGWQRRSADSITAYYLESTSSLHRMLLSHSDSLFLSREQMERFRVADSVYSVDVRAVYRPLGDYLANLPSAEPGKAQLDSVTATERAYWRVFWGQVPIADAILTPMQRALMPTFSRMVETPEHERNETRRYRFGNTRVQMVPTPTRDSGVVPPVPAGSRNGAQQAPSH